MDVAAMRKVLVLSYECWKDDVNGGNVLSNVFAGSDFEFAQVYCMSGKPKNALCKQYYQFTMHTALSNLLHKTPAGEAFSYPDAPILGAENDMGKRETGIFLSFLKRLDLPILYVIRDLLMLTANWRDERFKAFLTEFDPDVIFAPLYSSHFMFAMNRYAFELLKKPVVSFVSDDVYSLKQIRLSPVYWVNRLVQRSRIRALMPFYSFMYTMTDEQAEQMRQDFHCDMRILRKCVDRVPSIATHDEREPIRFIYAGGIYLGREQTLAEVARAIRQNAPGVARLDVYSNSSLSCEMHKELNDGVTTFLHAAIPFEDLMRRYRESDIALHVESFRRKYALQTRLSFSTKIVDCLAGGCAVLAIGPKINAGIRYLQNENAAVCVEDERWIQPEVQRLIDHPEQICVYAGKALDCARRNHDPNTVRAALKQDIEVLAAEVK